MKNVKNMCLLMVGYANWNYYYDYDSNIVMAIVKPEEQYRGSVGGTFGSIKFFSKYLREEYRKDESVAGKFTAAGFACFNYGAEEPQRFVDYVTKF
jgi:hypothetical protein